MATVTSLNFNINSRFSSTGITQARAAMATFDEEQRRQERLRAVTQAQRDALDRRDAAARITAERNELQASLAQREAAWQQELSRRQAVLRSQLDAERRYWDDSTARTRSALSNMESTTKKTIGSMLNQILLLGPALIPIAGGLLGIGAAAGSAFVSAGAAVGIFGFALKQSMDITVGANSAFGQSGKALDSANKALAKTTVGAKGYGKALKAVKDAESAHKAAIDAMPPVQQRFAEAYDGMKESILAFGEANAQFTLRPATTMVEAFTSALPKLTGVIQAMEPEIQRVANLIKKWVEDGGLDRFLNFVIKYGVPAVHGFVNALRSLFSALGTGMRDTAPLGKAFTDWLQKITKGFQGWASGGGFQRFLQWLSDNKATLIGVLKNLGTFLANIAQSAASQSGTSLTLISIMASILSKISPGLITAITYAWIGWNLALEAYAIYATIAAAATTVLALAAAPFGLLIIGAALTVGALVLALAALGVAIYFIVKYWDQISGAFVTAWNATWTALKIAWDASWKFIKNIAISVWNWLNSGWHQFLLLLLGPIGILIFIGMHWKLIWETMKTTASAVWNWIKDVWAATVGGLKTAYDAAIGPVMNSWNTVWPQMKLAAQNVWDTLKTMWSGLWTAMTAVWNVFWGFFGPSVKANWSLVVSVATALWNVLTAAWNVIWTIMVSVFKVGMAVLTGAWNVAWAVMTSVAKISWAVLTGAWSVVWTVVTGIWNTFYATFSAIFSGAWKVIVAIFTAIWNVIKATWTALWAVVTAIFMTFLAVFTGNWSGAWNAISAAAQAVWNVLRVAWQGFVNILMAVVNAFIGVFRAAWGAFWTAVQAAAVAVWNAFRVVFQTFLTAVQTVWTAVWNAIRTVFQTVINAIIAVASAAWAALHTAMSAFLTAVQALWNAVWTAIRTFFGTVVDNLKTAAGALWTALQAVFTAGSTWLRTTFWNPVHDFFTKTIPGAFDAAVAAVGKAWDKLRGIVRAPVQAIVNVVYNDGIVKLWNVVAGVFGAPKLNPFNLPQFKEGGPTGNGSSDGFLAKVHPGEHVWTRDEVAGAGGHQAVAAMRRQAMGGAKVRLYGKKDFDDGGGILGTGLGPNVGPDLVPDGIVKNALGGLAKLALGAISGPFGAAVDAVAKVGKSAVKAAIPGSGSGMETLGTGMVDKIATTVKDWVKKNDIAPDIIGGNADAGLAWAKTQVGKPYQWGGNGNPSWDCSGFMSAIESVIRGEKPHRRWATGSFSGGTAPPGWKLNDKSPFMIGVTNAGVGHTAGTLNGINVESSGGVGVRVGGGARGAKDGMFQNVYGFAGAKGGGSGATVGAAQATAKAMLSQYGWAASEWPSLQKLWQGESGWNYKAKNPSSGALGIPQALPGSKMASAGKDYLTNATTQIKWGEGYIKSVYGSPSAAYSKWLGRSPHWYARGTGSAYPGPAIVGERGAELMQMRGGEKITPLGDLEGSGGNTITIPVSIDARGATVAAVQRMETVLPDKLRMALEQGTGRRN